MKNIKPISVLIPEGENINLLNFVVNCLAQAKNLSISVVFYSKFLEFRKTNKVKYFIDYPKYVSEEEWISNINNEVNKYDFDIIMPVDDYGIKTAIKYKNLLLKPEKLVLFSKSDDYFKADDKGLLAKHLNKFLIPTPKSFLIESGNSLENKPDVKLPVLAKPTLGFGGGKGIIKFTNFEDLSSYFKENKFEYDFLVEEYIEGYDLGCNVLCKNGKILAYTMQKGNLWSNKPYSPQIGLEFFYNHQLYNQIEKLMQSLNWNGVANIDIRFDVKTKQFLILEINPRFWETTEASEAAGVNFPYLYCLTSLNIDFEVPKYKKIEYLNLLGLNATIKANKFFIFKFKFLFNNTTLKYYVKDPLPLLYVLFYKIKSLV
jgi:D-aspartate ligase